MLDERALNRRVLGMANVRYRSFAKGPELAQYAQEQIEWVELRIAADQRDLRNAQAWLRTAAQLTHTSSISENDNTKVG